MYESALLVEKLRHPDLPSVLVVLPVVMLALGSRLSFSSKWQNSVAVLDTELWRWRHPTVDGSTPAPRSYHSATVVGNLMVVFGGNNQNESFDRVYVLDTGDFNVLTAAAGGRVVMVCERDHDNAHAPSTRCPFFLQDRLSSRTVHKIVEELWAKKVDCPHRRCLFSRRYNGHGGPIT